MNKTIKLTFFILLLISSAISQNKVEIFDKYVEASRLDWKVPGLSIVVVQDGKVLLSKGYGVREHGKNAKVDAETLFGAMSTTKAMTAVTMGMLVDEGKVSWDDKVVKHLPNFRVADPYVTSEIKVRDLFTHNAGLGNADFLWSWTPDLPADEIVRRMQYAKQAYSFRGGYTYQNIMYLVAGQVIEKVSGMSWERFVTERLFAPLGMKNTFPNYETSRNYQNRSLAHFEIDGSIRAIPESLADPIAPAGSVWSTADDIGKWVNFMLGNTTVNGKQLLKPATYQAILRPQIIVPPGQFYPTVALTKPHWTTYGFAWFQHDYRGEMVAFHTGSLAGRTAIVGMIPDKKLGVYVFGNLDHAEVRHALMYKVFDVFGFDDNSRDWSKETKTLYDGIEADGNKQAAAVRSRRLLNTRPSLPLASYAGRYSDPFYGSMVVTFTDAKLKLTTSSESIAELNHWHLDTFEATWNKAWRGKSMISFQLNPQTGEAEALIVSGAVLKREARVN